MSGSFKDVEDHLKHLDEPNEHTDATPAALLEQLIYVDSFMPDSDPTSFDNQLTAELAAFADDSFIFPDEEKPKINDQNDGHTPNGRYNHGINLGDNSALHAQLNGNGNNEDPNNIFINNNFTEGNIAGTQSINNAFNQENGNEINPDLLSQSLVTILSSQGNTNNSVIDSLSASLLSNVPKVYVPPGASSTLASAGLSQIQIDALAALIAQHQSRSGTGVHDQSSLNESTGFHDSAVNALNGLSHNSTLINNFTPNDQQYHGNAPISNLVSILNANSPRAPTRSNSTIEPQNNTVTSQNIYDQGASQYGNSNSPQGSSTTTSPMGTMAQQYSSAPSPSNGSSDAVDSDKRRRNTAASARFRIKKKLREQEMERNIRELNENSHKLQMRIQQLEMENRLLRNLVVEKGAQRNNDELEQLKQRAREGI